jgi:hypothetical protein
MGKYDSCDATYTHLSHSEEDADDEVGFIDACDLSDSSTDEFVSFCRQNAANRRKPGNVVHYPDLIDDSCDLEVVAGTPHLEYCDTAYFNEDGAHGDAICAQESNIVSPRAAMEHSANARIRSYLNSTSSILPLSHSPGTQSTSLVSSDRKFVANNTSHSQQRFQSRPADYHERGKRHQSCCTSIPEDPGDSGYADSSVCTDSRQAGDVQVESVHLESRRSSSSATDQTEVSSLASSTMSVSPANRLLTRRQFHHSAFVRYRYPVKFHQTDSPKSKSQKNKQTRFQLPPSLKPHMRYDKEPLVQRSAAKAKTKTQWAKPPRYPPNSRHVGVTCEIIKLMDKIDIGVQCSQPMQDMSCQCVAGVKDSHTQCPKVKRKARSVQTITREYQDTSVQHKPETRNRMVDTDISVMYFPAPSNTHICSKCDMETAAHNTNYWVNSNLPHS